MKDTGLAFGVAIGWLLVLTVLLTLPGSAIPQENWMNRIWLDKWVHIALFSLLVILWANALGKKYPRARSTLVIWIAIAALAYGIGMEFVQRYFVSNRSFDLGDIAADGMGCLIAGFYRAGGSIKK